MYIHVRIAPGRGSVVKIDDLRPRQVYSYTKISPRSSPPPSCMFEWIAFDRQVAASGRELIVSPYVQNSLALPSIPPRRRILSKNGFGF